MGRAEDQAYEQAWWGDCLNTFGEEAKQIVYASKMGLANQPVDGCWPLYDVGGRSVLDIGGGPVSMLLKTRNLGRGVVVDPCRYPRWVEQRYAHAGITTFVEDAETFRTAATFDECWIYNVLQHVVDPQACIETAKAHAKVLRIFEWIDCGTSLGHPHELHSAELDEWVGASRGEASIVGTVNENGCVGLAYWGVFDLASRSTPELADAVPVLWVPNVP